MYSLQDITGVQKSAKDAAVSEGSYHVSSFATSTQSEIRRLDAQVDLFWHAESQLLERYGLRPGMDYLDCGCGPGGLMERIRERFPGVRLTGLEMDPILVEAARAKFRQLGDDQCRIVQGTAEETGLPEGTFDFITMRLVLEHVPDPVKALRSLKRLLKPGGRLFIISNDFEYHTRTWPPVEELHDLYRGYRASRRKDGGDPCIGRRVPQLLREAGFRPIGQEVEVAHSALLGDEAFTRAEGVGIAAKLVEDGFLEQATLDRMIKAWKDMLSNPDHSITRQLFVAVGENSAADAATASAAGKPARVAVAAAPAPAVAGAADLQKVVEEIWAAALQAPKVDARANFFDSGGTSLALMDVQDMLLQRLGKDVPMATLFQYPTIEGLVQHLSGGEVEEGSSEDRRREAMGKRKRSNID
jgi:ubiquinone/menaquinone biosynthesis C-methylase UbiE/acyl carrier protein